MERLQLGGRLAPLTIDRLNGNIIPRRRKRQRRLLQASTIEALLTVSIMATNGWRMMTIAIHMEETHTAPLPVKYTMQTYSTFRDMNLAVYDSWIE